MKLKRNLALLLVGVLTLGANTLIVSAEDAKDVMDGLEVASYVVTLEQVEPIKEGDDYGWMLTSEPGQLSNSLNALGLNYFDPDYFGEDNVMLYAEDGIDLEQIYSKLGLIGNIRLSDDLPIAITYTQDDISEVAPKVITESEDESNGIIPMTTGSFNRTISANGRYNTVGERKDDSEQRAYFTLTNIAPTAYQGYNGIVVRVNSYNHNSGMTAYVTFRTAGSYTIPYRTFRGEPGVSYYLSIDNASNRAIDVAGRWTP